MLPENFGFIKDGEDGIRIDLVYGDDFNFVGKTIDGYLTTKTAFLNKEVIKFLKMAQKELLKQGLSLVVKDAYRPQRAVDHFISWAKDLKDQKMKSYFYPFINKHDVFSLGYLAKRSKHSQGIAVDITVVKIDADLGHFVEEKRILKNGQKITYTHYKSEFDMGTHVDFLDNAAHTDSDLVDENCQKNRMFLKNLMEKYNFKNYRKEWWHFELDKEEPREYLNFPIRKI